jgi:two-component system phosphate regulon response regulator PhoB
VHSRASLLDKVWGDHVYIEERTVDVHVKRLREALGAAGSLVETVRGAGYRLTAKPLVAPGVNVAAGKPVEKTAKATAA